MIFFFYLWVHKLLSGVSKPESHICYRVMMITVKHKTFNSLKYYEVFVVWCTCMCVCVCKCTLSLIARLSWVNFMDNNVLSNCKWLDKCVKLYLWIGTLSILWTQALQPLVNIKQPQWFFWTFGGFFFLSHNAFFPLYRSFTCILMFPDLCFHGVSVCANVYVPGSISFSLVIFLSICFILLWFVCFFIMVCLF